MKKILVGICGIGNGHINRQINIIQELVKRNFKIIIATTKEKINTLNYYFPDIPKITINIPWVECNSEGINYEFCLEKYEENGIDLFKELLVFSKTVEELFNGKPDFIISDYEPNVAQYSYMVNKPLICMEQQSKFLYMNEKKIKKYSINEEKYRLNYFFPKVDYQIISSFFPLDIKKDNVFVIPPIIKKFNPKKKIDKKGIVYFSPYSNDKRNFLKILNMIKKIKDINFTVYTELDFSIDCQEANVVFKKFSNEFKEELLESSFVIASAGHQLISECIACEVPMYLFPLDTYEQNYNCSMVEKYELGKKFKGENIEEFCLFYKNIPNYVENIKKHKRDVLISEWNVMFNEVIDIIIDEQKKEYM